MEGKWFRQQENELHVHAKCVVDNNNHLCELYMYILLLKTVYCTDVLFDK